MATEFVYLLRDNTIDLILQADGAAVDLAAVDQIDLLIGDTTIESTNLEGDPIRWEQVGYDTGEIRISLGQEALTEGYYRATLIVYDPTNANGVVWGTLMIKVVADQ